MKKNKGISLFKFLILFILFFIIISTLSNIFDNINLKDEKQAQEKIISKARKYVKNNEELLNEYFEKDLLEFNLPIDILEKEDYISTDINGYIKITKNSEYNYEIIKYESKNKSLYSTIIDNNKIITEGDGLYINTNNKENNLYDLKYIFKGNNINNYININSTTYRIIGITDSYNIKAIRSEYNTNINSYGLGGNINFLLEEDDLKTVNNLNYLNNELTSKYFTLGIYNVGYVPFDIKSTIDVVKNEKRNMTITEKSPNYAGYAGLINISDLLNSSLNKKCNMQNIRNCNSYLYELLEKGLITSNTTSNNEDYSIYILTKNGLNTTINTNFESNKEVVYIKGSIEYLKGNGSISNPYMY